MGGYSSSGSDAGSCAAIGADGGSDSATIGAVGSAAIVAGGGGSFVRWLTYTMKSVAPAMTQPPIAKNTQFRGGACSAFFGSSVCSVGGAGSEVTANRIRTQYARACLFFVWAAQSGRNLGDSQGWRAFRLSMTSTLGHQIWHVLPPFWPHETADARLLVWRDALPAVLGGCRPGSDG